MSGVFHAHARNGLICQSGAPIGGAMEREALLLVKDFLEIRAIRINPELNHTARTVEAIGDIAVSFALADVANIDNKAIRVTGLLDRIAGLDLFDLGTRHLDHLHHTHLQLAHDLLPNPF